MCMQLIIRIDKLKMFKNFLDITKIIKFLKNIFTKCKEIVNI